MVFNAVVYESEISLALKDLNAPDVKSHKATKFAWNCEAS